MWSHVFYDTEIQRICLPLGDKSFTTRSVRDEPKWKHYYLQDSDKMSPYMAACELEPGLRVLVEDPISAMKISEIIGFQGVALLGLGNADRIRWIKTQAHNYLVWLDNDKPSVIKAAHKIGADLGCPVLTDKIDPKRYSTQEIIDVITSRYT